MADIKLDLVQVGGIKEYADRSVDIQAIDRVRGPIIIRMQEDEARWLFAQGWDQLTRWRTADEEADED